MANLLPRTSTPEPFPRLDPEQLDRFRLRRERLAGALSRPAGLRLLERQLSAFDASLEELESGNSLMTAHALLDGFDRARSEVLIEADEPDVSSNQVIDLGDVRSEEPETELLCYWPGRSLSTGESELASRGFFDVMDRPPLAYWLEAIARPTGAKREVFEVAILVWIPPSDLARARAGRQSCGNGSLAFLREVSTELALQLQSAPDDVVRE